ncbi:MAG TPA: insulinase family protein [Candidatus Acetothermia bacterium]|nr:insulinase family protein [Candidatus Acetothermia bacterium]
MPVRTLYPHAYEARLENGLRILIEEAPQSRSVSVGVWVHAGSRDDPPALHGLSHFIEHLTFKGTATRDARTLSHAIDAVGGTINAATAKESTFYYADVPSDGWETALDILSDLTLRPALAATDVDLERNVILEEIRGHLDDPEQTAYDLFNEDVWGEGHPVARSIVGSMEAIESVRREDVLAYHHQYYRPDNMVLAMSGRICARRVVDRAAEVFSRPNGALLTAPKRIPSRFHPVHTHHERPTGMMHIYMGGSGPTASDDDRIPLEVVNSILGDGTSSRLFNAIRETRGLAYVITSYVSSFSDGGVWMTYAGTAPQNAATVIELIQDEFRQLLRLPIPEAELQLAKAKLRGHLILALESNAHRASRLANAAIHDREILSPDELLARLDAVTCDSAQTVLNTYLCLDQLSITTIGPST